LAGIGYAGSNIVYDAFLVDVTEDDRMDYVSSFGFAIGYIGSCVPFIISIALVMAGGKIGLTGLAPVKIVFAINAVWWLLFSIPFVKDVKQVHGVEEGAKNIVADAFVKVMGSIKTILKNKTIALFLLAYFFYIDGVDTIIKMSAIYGDSVGIDTPNMIIALLVTQIVAFPAVLIFAKVAKRFSAKKVILSAVAVYIGICVFGYFLQYAWQFWTLAITVGLVQGTIQALSRSYFGRLIPDKNRSNEYFGFYNILGRYAAVLGPALMGGFSLLTGNTNTGVLSIALLFIAGFVTLMFVPDKSKT
jgi:UMF1 family MFS transporter